eukprot:3624631-Rhodomonas_salina.4
MIVNWSPPGRPIPEVSTGAGHPKTHVHRTVADGSASTRPSTRSRERSGPRGIKCKKPRMQHVLYQTPGLLPLISRCTGYRAAREVPRYVSTGLCVAAA